MKSSILNIKALLICGAMIGGFTANAGNEDRIGQAGAAHLLVNPWARSSALGDVGISFTNGLEATFTNIAGLASTNKTQIKFNYTNWMGSMTGLSLNSAGIAQRLGASSVIAVSIQALSYGDIMITTVQNPEGGIGTFSPRANIFNVGYAHTFSASISGGINIKVISESIANMKTTGVAIDAGIRYVSGEQEQLKFGIALKNVGPVMKYKGDGLNTQVQYLNASFIGSLEQRTATFEMPSLLSIGGSYDFIFNDKNRLILGLGFTANSFSYDQFRIGLDYGFSSAKVAFNLRGGYVYEKGIFNAENRANALIGPTAGFSVDALVGESKSALGIEYAARFAGPFGVIHTIGATISLK